jgi:hypothetical protein
LRRWSQIWGVVSGECSGRWPLGRTSRFLNEYDVIVPVAAAAAELLPHGGLIEGAAVSGVRAAQYLVGRIRNGVL